MHAWALLIEQVDNVKPIGPLIIFSNILISEDN